MTFDTFDTDSVATYGITFSGGNLTATGISAMGLLNSGIAQTVEGKKSGKWYVEFTLGTASGNNDGVGVINSVGVANSGFIGNSATGIGTYGSAGIGYYNSNGHVAYQGASQTAVNNSSYAASTVVGLAIDLTNKKVWWTINGGSTWVGTSGTPNPATNTSGFDITALLANNGRIYPAANLSGAASWTLNAGATAFSGTVPSGFTSGWTNTTAGTYFGTFATTGYNSPQIQPPVQNSKSVSAYTASVTGQVTSVVAPFAGSGLTDLQLVIYDATGAGGLPGALLYSGTGVASGNYGENTFTVSGVSVVSGTKYWFGFVTDTAGSSATNTLLCPTQTGGIAYNSATYNATPSNPFGASPSSANSRFPLIINVTVDTLSAATWAGSGALSGAVTDISDVKATWAGAGTVAWVSPPSGNSQATWAGTGTVAWVAAPVSNAVATWAGHGALAATSASAPGSAFAIGGAGVFDATSLNASGSVASFTGSGVFGAAAFTVEGAAEFSNGKGVFDGAGAWSALDPLDYTLAYSVMFYGSLIEGVIYDPISRWMKVLYTNALGQYILIANQPITVTNQILAAANPQAYVQSLITR